MALISVRNLKKTYGPKLVFENVSFELNPKDRVSLVGRNGTGKTTILKIITDKEYADEGDIYKKKDIRIGYLEQEPDYGNLTARAVICLAKENLKEVNNYIDSLVEKMSYETDGNLLMKLSERYDRALNEYANLGGYEFESDIAKVANGLKISDRLMDMPFSKLSGGEKTRVLLAKLLLEKPEVLLLDEPTNHLDIESMEWLEKYLNEYPGALLLVSHDRYFLDSVVNKIYELDIDGIEEYDGNYTRYTIEKELRYLSRMKSYTSQQYIINRMEMQIKKFRALNTPGLNKKANEIEHRLERMPKLPKPILERKSISLSDVDSSRSGKDVIVVEDLGKIYGDNIIFEGVNLKMRYQDRIGIVGKNGCGKTTLIRTILGEEEPDCGIVKIGTKLDIGYLKQNISFEESEKTILDYYSEQFGISPTEARNRLAKILFTGNDVFKKIGSLSGGEKKRLQLSILLDKKPNFIILDEPTNHLDLNSREILEENLMNFEGNLLIVSHDRYFLNKLANSLWVYNDGTFVSIDGNYEYFRQNRDNLLAVTTKKKTVGEKIVKVTNGKSKDNTTIL